MRQPLASAVRDLLAQEDENAALRWQTIFMNHRPNDYKLPYDRQLAAINHFWRVQLAQLPVCTIEERECLTDGIDIVDWLRNFKRYVIPTILEHGLPTNLLERRQCDK